MLRRWRFALLVLPAIASCGARTELYGREPCGGSDPELRPCHDGCAEGTQECRDGYWRECQAPLVSEPCENDCGSGVSTCSQGVWSACEVPEVAVECESVCGKGQEICSGGSWKPCDAPQPKPPKLRAVVRDFDDTHPDFEILAPGGGIDSGIVASELGPDDKPVYGEQRRNLDHLGQGELRPVVPGRPRREPLGAARAAARLRAG